MSILCLNYIDDCIEIQINIFVFQEFSDNLGMGQPIGGAWHVTFTSLQ